MVARKKHKEILNMMYDFMSAIYVVKNEATNQLKGEKSAAHNRTITRAVTFSDSIILVSENDSNNAADEILFWTSWIVGAAIEYGIPIKGSIAYGLLTNDFDNDIHFGQPLIDAFLLQDQLSMYGIVLHHTAEQYLLEKAWLRKLQYPDIVELTVPMKSGRITHSLVNWSSINEEVDKEKIYTGLMKIYRSVSGYPRQYVDNTVDFLKKMGHIDENIVKKNKEI